MSSSEAMDDSGQDRNGIDEETDTKVSSNEEVAESTTVTDTGLLEKLDEPAAEETAENADMDDDEDVDLFGDDDEEVKDGIQNGGGDDEDEEQDIVKRKKVIMQDDDEDDEMDVDGDQDVQIPEADEEDQEEEVVEEKDHKDVQIPRYNHQQPTSTISYTKLPAFMSVEPKIFTNANELDLKENYPEDAEGLGEYIKDRISNTCRWRRNESGERESNARFIEWDDGSMSLQIGKEVFDVQGKESEFLYLYMSHVQSEILQSRGRIDEALNLLPTTYEMAINHKKNKDRLEKSILRKKQVTQFISTDEDPETLKRKAEKLEGERLRAQRRLDNQKKRQSKSYSAYGSTGGRATLTSGALEEDDEDIGYERGAADTGDYEADDFVVDDDDSEVEEENRQARLRDLKEQGARAYREKTAKAPVKRKGKDESDEEDEDEDEESEGSAEETPGASDESEDDEEDDEEQADENPVAAEDEEEEAEPEKQAPVAKARNNRRIIADESDDE